MNPRRFYDTLLAQMPAGLERAALRILSYHIGKDHAISKPDLLAELARVGFALRDERQARKTIVELRKAGHLICSSSGEGGYYLAATPEEYDEFAQVEYRAKIVDMSETVRAMDDGARQLFHSAGKQPGLF